MQSYRSRLDQISLSRDSKWARADYLPFETITDAKILDKNGQPITTFEELENKLPQKAEHIYDFEDAYVDTRYFGRVKTKEIKYVNIEKADTKVFILDARDFIKAILKDALSGEIKFFDKKGNVE